jgi:hypothetical protein
MAWPLALSDGRLFYFTSTVSTRPHRSQRKVCSSSKATRFIGCPLQGQRGTTLAGVLEFELMALDIRHAPA